MATKKTTEKKEDVKVSKLILSPRITEKASVQSEANAYTFVVAPHATKHSIIAEIKKEHKVTPKAVNIITIPQQAVFVRGRFGTKAKLKKAVVFLKKGDVINLA
jgi:large subunit ribosomal protein L23